MGWGAAAIVGWIKLGNKLNGLGLRVRRVEDAQSVQEGRMARMERELAEYRKDVQITLAEVSRLAKGMEGIREDVTSGNLVIGTQLHGIEKLIYEKDQRNTNRLVRVETLTRVEAKVGPVPTD